MANSEASPIDVVEHSDAPQLGTGPRIGIRSDGSLFHIGAKTVGEKRR